MNIATLRDVSLHWREDGNPNGPVIVFANSLGTDLRLWDKLLPSLPSHLRIIRFDKRGHGLSSCPDGPYKIDDLVDDTEQLLDSIKIRQCLFVGLSIGGMIGQALALRRPDLIQAMVLSNTAAKMGDPIIWQQRINSIQKDGMSSMADAIMKRWFGSAFLSTAEAIGWRHMLLRTPETGYTGCCHAIANADLTETTPRLRLPVMGIAGSSDAASPAELVAATISLIADAQFHVIQEAGHLPCVECPSEYTALLGNFIESIGYDKQA